jgi:hypothetical protein
MDFFSPGTMDTFDHGIKTTPNELLSFIQIKKIFPKKSIRIALPTMIFDLQNDFHEDWLSFLVHGEKINLGHFKKKSKLKCDHLF